MILSNKRIKRVIDTMEGTCGICITDMHGIVQFVNNYFCKITQHDKSLLLDQSFHNMNLQLNDLETPFFETIFNKEVWKGEVTFHTLKNEKKYLYLIVIPIQNNNDEITHFIVLANDIIDYMMVRELANETTNSLTNITKALDEASIVAITNRSGVIIHVNDKFCEISKYQRKQLIGKTHRIINSNHHSESFFKHMWETILSGQVWQGEVKNRAQDGSYYWVNTTIVPVLNRAGKPKQFISIRTDITKRIKAETELARVMEDDFKRVVQNLQNWIFKVEEKNNQIKVLLSEGQLAEKLNLVTRFVRGKTVHELLDKENAHKIETQLIKAFTGEKINIEMAFNDMFIDMMLTPVIENDKVTEVVGSVADITARKKAEDTILHMANHDSLTNLVNRHYFTQLLTEELNTAKQKQQNIAVMFIDLDRFKNINDSLGHHTGDKILKKISKYLKASVRTNDVVSRLGGDEFAIFLPDVGREEASTIAARIKDTLSNPLALETLELYVTPSIGISLFPEDGKNVDDLLKNADVAMYLAKKQGRNNYQFFTKELNESLISRLELEIDLRKALGENQLELYYQTKVDIEKNKIIGAEALIRWNHPVHGLVPPNDFIPIAEETGLIIDIGKWVLETACEQAKTWHEKGHNDLTIAVNISLRQFLQNNLHLVIKNTLDDTKLDPKYLELEITESMTSDAEYTINTLNKIKELDVTVSIDDFGTGYSSLSYLSKFPVDKLKIDQSFVRDLNNTNKSIIKAIINVANNLNIDVIAEGVEEKKHVDFLLDQGCNEAQGYFFSKPVPIDQINKILTDKKLIKFN